MQQINFILNHVQQSKERLITQYKAKPNVEGLLESFVLQIQELENDLKNYNDKKSIFTAEGQHLDRWGTLLLEPRFGLNDGDYRVQLLAKIAQNFSEGTPNDLIAMFKAITRANYIVYSEIYPAEITMTAVGVDLVSELPRVKNVLSYAKAAGVNVTGAIVTTTDVFAFEGDVDPNSLGFGDVNDVNVGGQWAFII